MKSASEARTIHCTGDVHGRWAWLAPILPSCRPDVCLCAGVFGWGPRLLQPPCLALSRKCPGGRKSPSAAPATRTAPPSGGRAVRMLRACRARAGDSLPAAGSHHGSGRRQKGPPCRGRQVRRLALPDEGPWPPPFLPSASRRPCRTALVRQAAPGASPRLAPQGPQCRERLESKPCPPEEPALPEKVLSGSCKRTNRGVSEFEPVARLAPSLFSSHGDALVSTWKWKPESQVEVPQASLKAAKM